MIWLIALLTMLAPVIAVSLTLDAIGNASVRKAQRAGFYKIGEQS